MRLIALLLITITAGQAMTPLNMVKSTVKHTRKHKVVYSMGMEMMYLGVSILRSKSATKPVETNWVTITQGGTPQVGKPH